ncbi:hypothetical protein Tco_1545718, partial [Tanacetum coccineum]
MSDDKTPPAANGAAATDANVNININITAPEEDHPDSAVVPNPMSKIQLLEQDLVNAKLKIKHLEDDLLLEMLKESEEKMREFQTGKARKIEVL